ncbi:helix-turn-helix domain-containing protein [Streptomyces sp. NPDC048290]|uniref:helix-turn-helix domain-containing protein n=1 Tax=Streptomyces sp. NPDC048290 TaxID=3155811 RepID=UPI00343ABA28
MGARGVSEGKGGGSPIGRRVRTWRTQRGISRDHLADLLGVDPADLSALEEGRGWWDRRGLVHRAAAVLRVGVEELTGQPYLDVAGADAAEVRGCVVAVRRALMVRYLSAGSDGGRKAAAGRDVVHAAELGDDLALARGAAGVVAALRCPGGDGQSGQVVAGWLRRWGYGDLAWSVLQRARACAGASPGLVAEEVRVLLDGGAPDRALERAGYPGEVDAVTGPVMGVALAVLGQFSEAERVLAAAVGAAESVGERAGVEVARAVAALEAGRPELALECCARLPGADEWGAGLWAEALVVGALAEARFGDVPAAVRSLAGAAGAAPLRTLVDPWARELLSALAGSAPGEDGVVLRAFAARAGVLSGSGCG